jgi:hypothetical protein
MSEIVPGSAMALRAPDVARIIVHLVRQPHYAAFVGDGPHSLAAFGD